MNLTQEQLKEHLHYNPDTGDFTRLLATCGKVKVGDVAGYTTVRGYCVIRLLGKIRKAHRLAFLYMEGAFPENVVDHIDGDPSNNAWTNLRACSVDENAQNARLRKDSSSGVKGVHFDKRSQKWVVQVRRNSIRTNLGYYDDLELAELVATEARELYHGAYAKHI